MPRRRTLKTNSSFELHVWNDKEEDSMIEFLIDATWLNRLDDDVVVDSACEEIGQKLELKFGVNFPLNKVKNKFLELRKRYTEFNALIKSEGVEYAEESNEVFVTSNAWTRYIMEFPDGTSYRINGERCWQEMKFILGSTEQQAEWLNTYYPIKSTNALEGTSNFPIMISDSTNSERNHETLVRSPIHPIPLDVTYPASMLPAPPLPPLPPRAQRQNLTSNEYINISSAISASVSQPNSYNPWEVPLMHQPDVPPNWNEVSGESNTASSWPGRDSWTK